jgi:hypothetical protein
VDEEGLEEDFKEEIEPSGIPAAPTKIATPTRTAETVAPIFATRVAVAKILETQVPVVAFVPDKTITTSKTKATSTQPTRILKKVTQSSPTAATEGGILSESRASTVSPVMIGLVSISCGLHIVKI